MIKMKDQCDLCNCLNLKWVYTPDGSKRGLKIYVCNDCGLVQSHPRIDHVKERVVTASGGADWGNIRYGKAFQTMADLETLKDYLTDEIKTCLDIGSNRGSFLLALLERFPQLEFWGIEPDRQIVDNYYNNDHIKLIVDRLENIKLPNNYFDLIYCSHTLEHLKYPSSALDRIWEATKSNGILFLEVPNIDLLKSKDVLEEWFIDKHLYHFSSYTIATYLDTHGFEILTGFPKIDSENISMIAKKVDRPSKIKIINKKESQRVTSLLKTYDKRRMKNLKTLPEVAMKLNKLAQEKRLVVWGAGRIFDNLVKIGGLDVNKLAGVIDKYLIKYVKLSNGVPLTSAEKFLELNPNVALICSRAYYNEIADEIQNRDSSCEIISFSDSNITVRDGGGNTKKKKTKKRQMEIFDKAA
jgi:ubiquinone/menaquinone biosynthesis C-methylase UbiE